MCSVRRKVRNLSGSRSKLELNRICNVWIYLLDSSGLDNEKHNSRKQNRDKMELHVKTRGPGHSTHVIMLHTHSNKDKTTVSICNKDRTKNK